MRHSILGLDPALAVVEVDQHILVIAHAKFLHVAELAVAVAGLNTLHEVVVILFLESIDQVNACCICGQGKRTCCAER